MGKDMPKEAAAPLVELLKDSDRDVRGRAASALGSMGKDMPKEAAAQLAALLKDSDSLVRRRAADALGSMGKDMPKEAAAPLVALLKDSDSGVRGQAASALGSMGKSMPSETVSALAKVLEDSPLPSAELAESLARSLSAREESVKGLLLKLLDRPSTAEAWPKITPLLPSGKAAHADIAVRLKILALSADSYNEREAARKALANLR